MSQASLGPSLYPFSPARRLIAEALGTALLLAVVLGSEIMGERLAGGDVAIALLGNMLSTGAALVVMITVFGPLSGAHFNPAVTLVFALRRDIAWPLAPAYVSVQGLGAAWAKSGSIGRTPSSESAACPRCSSMPKASSMVRSSE